MTRAGIATPKPVAPALGDMVPPPLTGLRIPEPQARPGTALGRAQASKPGQRLRRDRAGPGTG